MLFHMISLELTWFHLMPLDVDWFHLISLEFDWFHLMPCDRMCFQMISLDFTWFHLGSFDLTWFHSTALDFAWSRFVSLGITGAHWNPLEITELAGTSLEPIRIHCTLKRENGKAHMGEGKRAATPLYNQTARRHTQTKHTISRLVSPPQPIILYIRGGVWGISNMLIMDHSTEPGKSVLQNVQDLSLRAGSSINLHPEVLAQVAFHELACRLHDH